MAFELFFFFFGAVHSSLPTCKFPSIEEQLCLRSMAWLPSVFRIYTTNMMRLDYTPLFHDTLYSRRWSRVYCELLNLLIFAMNRRNECYLLYTIFKKWIKIRLRLLAQREKKWIKALDNLSERGVLKMDNVALYISHSSSNSCENVKMRCEKPPKSSRDRIRQRLT